MRFKIFYDRYNGPGEQRRRPLLLPGWDFFAVSFQHINAWYRSCTYMRPIGVLQVFVSAS